MGHRHIQPWIHALNTILFPLKYNYLAESQFIDVIELKVSVEITDRCISIIPSSIRKGTMSSVVLKSGGGSENSSEK
jgi:hypothetical protein